MYKALSIRKIRQKYKNADIIQDTPLRHVLVDNEQISRVAENEFHRSRWWAYKWVKRYAESGLEGLKNLPRTGRPPQVSGQNAKGIH